MIDIKDLQIGDWVNYRTGWIDEETKEIVHESVTGFPIRLTCLYDNLSQYDTIFPDGSINTIEVADYELFPIPLTPEILEKNGLKPFEIDRLRDKHSSAKWWAKGGSFFVKQYNFKHNDFKPTYSMGTHSNSLIVGLKYVHELQHALRLCGIEKSIEL